jgi:excisionase family DNA binding protein
MEELLTPEQAAAILTVKSSTLEIWRCTKRYNLPYIKVGGAVRYRRSDLENFLQEGLRSGTALAGERPPRGRRGRVGRPAGNGKQRAAAAA